MDILQTDSHYLEPMADDRIPIPPIDEFVAFYPNYLNFIDQHRLVALPHPWRYHQSLIHQQELAMEEDKSIRYRDYRSKVGFSSNLNSVEKAGAASPLNSNLLR